jgi:hypothetical protein
VIETRLSLNCGDLLVERVQDCEAIVERNRQLRTIGQTSDWGRHIACIPNIIIEKWMNEEGANVLQMASEEFATFIRKKLDDPDWRHLRTT